MPRGYAIAPLFYAIFKSLKAGVWVPGHTEKMIDPEKLKMAARIEAYASYSEFVRRTALIEATKAIKRETKKSSDSIKWSL